MQDEIQANDPPASDRSAFMVEVFRPVGGPRLQRSGAEDARAILGVIDIPADETTLFVLASRDIDGALELIQRLGLQPMRAIEVRWSTARLALPC